MDNPVPQSRRSRLRELKISTLNLLNIALALFAFTAQMAFSQRLEHTSQEQLVNGTVETTFALQNEEISIQRLYNLPCNIGTEVAVLIWTLSLQDLHSVKQVEVSGGSGIELILSQPGIFDLMFGRPAPSVMESARTCDGVAYEPQATSRRMIFLSNASEVRSALVTLQGWIRHR